MISVGCLQRAWGYRSGHQQRIPLREPIVEVHRRHNIETRYSVVPSSKAVAPFRSLIINATTLLLLAAFAILIQGYHPGLEDDAFYLAAIKKDLNPSLFPHDADFFQLQFQATIFDKLIAFSLLLTH
jgi:hypothetical protein